MSGSFSQPGVPKPRAGGGAIPPYRICKPTAADATLVLAVAATDALLGVTGHVGAEEGKLFDLFDSGDCPIEFGATVAPGDPVTASANGRAVIAQPGERHIGFAVEGGDEGVIGTVKIQVGYVPSGAPLSPGQFAAAFKAAFPPGASGSVLQSDGTEWEQVEFDDAFTAAFPPGTTGNVLTSDGDNWESVAIPGG